MLKLVLAADGGLRHGKCPVEVQTSSGDSIGVESKNTAQKAQNTPKERKLSSITDISSMTKNS